MNALKDKKLLLLDMDGTIYFENTLFPYALEFFDLLNNTGRDYVFLTNNSSKSCKVYLEKLNKLGIKANMDNMFTSSIATIYYLNNLKPGATLYVVGTKALKEEFTEAGFNVVEDIDNAIDFLVIGYDNELNYKKLVDAVHLLKRGVEYIATNPDLVYPAGKDLFYPDCGSICNMLEVATGRKPFYIGKPRKEMVELILEKKGYTKAETLVIGDRLYTDIACGLNAGVTTALVLSGETKKEDLLTSPYKPDFVFDSIKDIYDIIK
ncbi:MAG: HAD-IIA family hydrolase [Bacilli bacterium]|nr:HAD-IIA family hydrolase [Bacilli bacterium]